MKTEPFHPRLVALLGACQVPFEMVDEIPKSDLGSSVGDSYWTGRRLVIERGCPDAWVAHEIAHWAVAKTDCPKYLGWKNYGIDSYRRDAAHRGIEWEDDVESSSADVTILILSKLRLPWLWAYRVMSIDNCALGWCGDAEPEKRDMSNALRRMRRRSGRYLKVLPL